MATIRRHNYKEVMDDGNVYDRKAETKISKQISGGWNMSYKDPLYDFIGTLTPAQFKLYRYLEDKILNEDGRDIKIIATKIIQDHRCPVNNAPAISRMLTHMVEDNMVMETKAKYYLFNPFVIIPSFADGEKLQREWGLLRQNKSFKRRGRDILDEYYDHKLKRKNFKLTFDEWRKQNEDIFIEPAIIRK